MQISKDSTPPASPRESDELADLLYGKYRPVMIWARKVESAGVIITFCGSLLFIIAFICLVRAADGAVTRNDELVIWSAVSHMVMGIIFASAGTFCQSSAKTHRASVTAAVSNCYHLNIHQAIALIKLLETGKPPRRFFPE